MALQGKFVINDADFSPLSIFGVGTFMAFSGNGAYRNRGGCTRITGNGPLPAGRYYVVDRVKGSIANRVRAWGVDTYKSAFYYPVDHSQWFALYRDDLGIDDRTWVDAVERGGFRLHPGQISDGCITLAHQSDFVLLRNALLRTQKMRVPCMKSLMCYGVIEVINSSYETTCP